MLEALSSGLGEAMSSRESSMCVCVWIVRGLVGRHETRDNPPPVDMTAPLARRCQGIFRKVSDYLDVAGTAIGASIGAALSFRPKIRPAATTARTALP